MKINRILDIFDTLVIVGLAMMLLAAFSYQFTVHDLPCSLCVMLRTGLYAIGFGLIINLTKQRNQTNYFLVIVASILELVISLEFIVRHIVPGSGVYGSSVLGLHMYTWSFITTFLIILYATIAGIFSSQPKQVQKIYPIVKLVIAVLIFTLLANIISTFIECGPYSCQSDPNSYWLINLFTTSH